MFILHGYMEKNYVKRTKLSSNCMKNSLETRIPVIKLV